MATLKGREIERSSNSVPLNETSARSESREKSSGASSRDPLFFYHGMRLKSKCAEISPPRNSPYDRTGELFAATHFCKKRLETEKGKVLLDFVGFCSRPSLEDFVAIIVNYLIGCPKVSTNFTVSFCFRGPVSLPGTFLFAGVRNPFVICARASDDAAHHSVNHHSRYV